MKQKKSIFETSEHEITKEFLMLNTFADRGACDALAHAIRNRKLQKILDLTDDDIKRIIQFDSTCYHLMHNLDYNIVTLIKKILTLDDKIRELNTPLYTIKGGGEK